MCLVWRSSTIIVHFYLIINWMFSICPKLSILSGQLSAIQFVQTNGHNPRYDQDARWNRKARNAAITKISKYVRKWSGIHWSMPMFGKVTDTTAVNAEAAANQLITWFNQSPGLQSISQEVTNQVDLFSRRTWCSPRPGENSMLWMRCANGWNIFTVCPELTWTPSGPRYGWLFTGNCPVNK